MTTPARDRWEIAPGTSFNYAFVPQIEDDDGNVSNEPGWNSVTYTLKIRDAQYTTAISKPLTVGSEWVYASLTPDDTNGFQRHRRYYFAIDMEYPSGEVRRVVEGPVHVRVLGGTS